MVKSFFPSCLISSFTFQAFGSYYCKRLYKVMSAILVLTSKPMVARENCPLTVVCRLPRIAGGDETEIFLACQLFQKCRKRELRNLQNARYLREKKRKQCSLVHELSIHILKETGLCM